MKAQVAVCQCHQAIQAVHLVVHHHVLQLVLPHFLVPHPCHLQQIAHLLHLLIQVQSLVPNHHQ